MKLSRSIAGNALHLENFWLLGHSHRQIEVKLAKFLHLASTLALKQFYIYEDDLTEVFEQGQEPNELKISPAEMRQKL